MKLPGFRTERRYFEMLNALATRVVRAGHMLDELFTDTSRAGEIVPRIKDVEHDADRLMAEVDGQLEDALITPMDPDDIHTLANRLDAVIDMIDGTARRVRWLHVDGAAPEHARRLADVVARSGEALAEAVRAIQQKRALTMHVHTVRLLEEEADSLYHDGIAILFDRRRDPLEVIKWKELYDRLEDTTDECQHTAQMVQRLAIKYGGAGQ